MDALQRLLESQLSKGTSRFFAMVEDKFQSFKGELSEDNASSLESAFKRLKRDSYTFKKEGNKRQYEHQEKFWNLSAKLRLVSPPTSWRKLQRKLSKVYHM